MQIAIKPGTEVKIIGGAAKYRGKKGEVAKAEPENARQRGKIPVQIGREVVWIDGEYLQEAAPVDPELAIYEQISEEIKADLSVPALLVGDWIRVNDDVPEFGGAQFEVTDVYTTGSVNTKAGYFEKGLFEVIGKQQVLEVSPAAQLFNSLSIGQKIKALKHDDHKGFWRSIGTIEKLAQKDGKYLAACSTDKGFREFNLEAVELVEDASSDQAGDSSASEAKAISLWQPWASLIVWGLKGYETRSWGTEYRGKLLICSAKKDDSDSQLTYFHLAQKYQIGIEHTWQSLPKGYAIALVDLVDCVEMTEEFVAQQSQRELDCGDWKPGRYAWKFANVQVIEPPIPIKGQQGLWAIDLKELGIEQTEQKEESPLPSQPATPPHRINQRCAADVWTELSNKGSRAVAQLVVHTAWAKEAIENVLNALQIQGLVESEDGWYKRKLPVVGDRIAPDNGTSGGEITKIEGEWYSIAWENGHEYQYKIEDFINFGYRIVSEDWEYVEGTDTSSTLTTELGINPETGEYENASIGDFGDSASTSSNSHADGLGEVGRTQIDEINLDNVRLDGGTQSRAEVNKETVAEYAQLWKNGTVFPPVIVYYDGQDYWLADGFHRCLAADEAGLELVPAEIRQGTRRDAVLHSVGANATHGLRRTNADKRRAVITLLQDEEWSQWSDREIARRTGVHHDTVGRIRAELSGGIRQIERKVERNGTTYTQKAKETPAPFNEGDRIFITGGFFEGFRGEVSSCPNSSSVLVKIDGQEKSELIPLSQLRLEQNFEATDFVEEPASKNKQILPSIERNQGDPSTLVDDRLGAPVPPPRTFDPHGQPEDREDDHYTPEYVWKLALECLGVERFDLDPCSNSKTAPNIPASEYFTIEDNGLEQNWNAKTLWMNPPYSETKQWVDKLIQEYEAENVTEAIALVKGDFSTRWFQPLLKYPICLVNHRIAFINPKNNGSSAKFASAIIYFGPNVEKFSATFDTRYSTNGIGTVSQAEPQIPVNTNDICTALASNVDALSDDQIRFIFEALASRLNNLQGWSDEALKNLLGKSKDAKAELTRRHRPKQEGDPALRVVSSLKRGA